MFCAFNFANTVQRFWQRLPHCIWTERDGSIVVQQVERDLSEARAHFERHPSGMQAVATQSQVIDVRPRNEFLESKSAAGSFTNFDVHISSIFDICYCDICYVNDKSGMWLSCCNGNHFICFQCFDDIARIGRKSTAHVNVRVHGQVNENTVSYTIIDCPFCRQKVTTDCHMKCKITM